MFYLVYFVNFNKIVFLVLYMLIPWANSEPGWFKVCNPEDRSLYQNYKVESESCPNGVWLPEASSLGCICVNGLWALTNDWCDEDYQLVYGQGHCFNVETQMVRKMSFLGNPEDPFETKDYITNSQAHVFYPLNDSQSVSEDSGNAIGSFSGRGITVLRISPEKNLMLKLKSNQASLQSDSICLKAFDGLEESEESDSLLIFTLNPSITTIEVGKECKPNPDSSDYFSSKVVALKPGKLLSVKSGKIMDSSESCYSTCDRYSSHERVKRGSKHHKQKGRRFGILGRAAKAPKQRILLDLKDDHKDLERSNATHQKHPKKDNCSEFNLYLKDSLLSDDEKMQIVNEETRRVLKIETNLLLNGAKGPSIANTTASRHWTMLQHVKRVFLKACPPTQVPPFVVNSIMRIFRYIFIHTRDGNPYGLHFEDHAQDKRIQDSLAKCFEDGNPFAFHYLTVRDDKDCRNESTNVTTSTTDSVSGNVTKSTTLQNATYCKCTTELNLVNFTYPKLNKTTTEVENTTFDLNRTIFLLPEMQKHMILGKNSTLGKHDFITETIWKMINFAHFYCARNFESNPHDHSALFNKLESFFNKDIIFRWNNPGNNSAAIWKVFYTAYDLEKFVESLDACVAGAKELSDYPKWLTRPTRQSRTKRELENPVMWDGNGFCLKDPWEPLDHLGLDVPQECREGRK